MNKIINILKKRKAIPLDQFINIALYDRKFGYYMKKNPFGKDGDFITSPLISNLFAEMIAIWCVAFWENLGKPKKILLVELGPGEGSLCKDLLNTFKNFPKFYESLNIKLLEKSNFLKKVQKNKIKNRKVKWINRISELKDGPIIFLANEFFDALPIKQIIIQKRKFYERHVVFSNSKKKLNFINKSANKKLIKNILKYNLDSSKNIIEYPAELIKYIKLIANKIKSYNGGLLVLDYGYTGKTKADTMESIIKHKHINILSNPGNSDITSHINYKLFVQILKEKNLKVEKIVNQNEFLKKMGIIERANIVSQTKTFKEKANIFFRLKKLLNYNEMGSLFKVLFALNKKIRFSTGFN